MSFMFKYLLHKLSVELHIRKNVCFFDDSNVLRK